VRTFGLKTPESDPADPGTIRHRAEEVAARLPALMVAAERVAMTVAQGVHGRRRIGQGETFWQFRRYLPGDPVQRIDWRQSAKREHVYIRENEWEAAQSVWIWLDRSPSMAYRSTNAIPTKSDRATLLTLALSSLLAQGGERVALLGSAMPPASGRTVLDRIATTLAHPFEGDTKDNGPPPGTLPRHARVVMISDFLTPPDAVAKSLRGFASMGVHGHLMQVFDPAEQSLPFSGRVRFEGLEGEGAAMIGRVEAVRKDYIELMENHRGAIRDIARSLGWTWTLHGTDQPPQTALLALFEALAEPRGL
jgi:uncharacterized protein (DUF58 family)